MLLSDFINLVLGLTSAFGGLEQSIRLVTIAYLSFVGVQILSVIGNVILLVTSLTKAFFVLGDAAKVAQSLDKLYYCGCGLIQYLQLIRKQQ